MSIRSAIALAAGLFVVTSLPASAQLSELHSKVRVGNKICFADHFHEGNSSGHRSEDAAERAAIRQWQDFTGLEYGSAWGNFGIAASKGIRCSKTGGWSCSVQARPCRRR